MVEKPFSHALWKDGKAFQPKYLAEPFVDTATRNLNKQYDNRDIFNLEAQKTLAEEKIIRDEKRQKENERKYDANQKRIKEKEIEMEQEKKKQDRKRKS